MTIPSYFVLRRLFRGVRPLARVAREYAESGAAVQRLSVDLGRHPLLDDDALRAFDDGLDTTLLQRALARVAAQPPGTGTRDSTPAVLPSAGRRGLRPESAAGAVDRPRIRSRVAGILDRSLATDVPAAPPARGADTVEGPRPPARRESEGPISRDTARETLAIRADRAGAGRGASRPIVPRAAGNPAMQALACGRELGPAALREAAIDVMGGSAPAAPAAPAAPRRHVAGSSALERLGELATLVSSRRATPPEEGVGERDAVPGNRLPHGAAESAHAPGAEVASRPGPLRRFAMQAHAAGQRRPGSRGGNPLPPVAAPSAVGAVADWHAPGAGEADDLARQLNDILRNEARRHGIDVDGVEL